MENPQNQAESKRAEFGQAPDPGEPTGGPDIWAELHRAQLLATQVSGWGGKMMGLAWLELRLALQSMPRMLGLALALVPIAGLTWITFSILLAWFAYAISDIVAVGLGTLFGLQLSVLLFCLWRMKVMKDRSSFRETRRQWQLFLQELTREQETDSSESQPANRH